MSDEVIAHMRDRVRRLRRVIELAQNPQMIAILEETILGIEADIATLEAARIEVPPTLI